MLIVFSGLPGTGKSTLARLLASRLNAVYLRIDILEQALRNAGLTDVGAHGYLAAYELARSNLTLGNDVIADCVNPVAESREAWREVANSAGVELLNIEVICADESEHRRRVETRIVDVPGLIAPTWQSVCAHDYQPWDEAPLRIDTARLSPDEAVTLIMQRLE